MISATTFLEVLAISSIVLIAVAIVLKLIDSFLELRRERKILERVAYMLSGGPEEAEHEGIGPVQTYDNIGLSVEDTVRSDASARPVDAHLQAKPKETVGHFPRSFDECTPPVDSCMRSGDNATNIDDESARPVEAQNK